MKRLFLIFLSFLLTGCTYLGATEDILISSPDDIVISSIAPQDYMPTTTTNESPILDGTTNVHGNSGPIETQEKTPPIITHLILNISSKKIHYFDNCSYANRMNKENRKVVDVSAEKSLLAEEYTICSWCASKRN